MDAVKNRRCSTLLTKHEDAGEKGLCLIAYADGELHKAVDAVSEGGLYSINDNVVSRNLSRLKT